MVLAMHTLKPAKGSKHKSKRLGRGNASGKGTYSTKGMKGQRARSGGRKGLKRLGMRRILLATPKHRGFKSRQPRACAIKLGDLENKIAVGETITRDRLVKLGFLHRYETRVKLLGFGKFTKKITVKGLPVSKKAREMIEAAGGGIEL